MKSLAIITFILIIGIVSFLIFKWYRANEIIYNYNPAKHRSENFSNTLPYRYFIPAIESNKKYPLMVYLHSASGRGTNNRKQLEQAAIFYSSIPFQKQLPMFVLAPQCPTGTQWLNTKFPNLPYVLYNQDAIPESPIMKQTMTLIKEFIKQHPIDTSRIYISGFSMGSSGSWDIITRYPGTFAAAILISGTKDTSKTSLASNTSFWLFHGSNDKICSPMTTQSAAKALIEIGADCKINLYEAGHNCVKETLQEPELISWLMSKSLKH